MSYLSVLTATRSMRARRFQNEQAPLVTVNKGEVFEVAAFYKSFFVIKRRCPSKVDDVFIACPNEIVGGFFSWDGMPDELKVKGDW